MTIANANPIKRPPEYMRRVIFAPFIAGPRFELYLVGTRYDDSRGRDMVSYRLDQINGRGRARVREIIAEGDDFGCSPMDAVDSDGVVNDLMGFLTLRKHDTDRETFEAIVNTPHHLQFSEEYAEYVSAEVYARFDPDGRK